jgi:hypothetical protein
MTEEHVTARRYEDRPGHPEAREAIDESAGVSRRQLVAYRLQDR